MAKTPVYSRRRGGSRALARKRRTRPAGRLPCPVLDNQGLVYRIAQYYNHGNVPFEDLIQEGNVGLLEAAKRFDPKRGVKFSTYAVWWIRAMMLDQASDKWRLVRLAQNMAALMNSIRPIAARLETRDGHPPTAKAIGAELYARLDSDSLKRVRHRLQTRLKRAPTRDEIMKELHIDPAHVAEAMDMIRVEGLSSLDAPAGTESDHTFHDLIADRTGTFPDAERLAGRKERIWAVREAVRMLKDPRERRIIMLRFGMKKGGERLTLEQIGETYGLTRERIRQIEMEARRKLKKILQARLV